MSGGNKTKGVGLTIFADGAPKEPNPLDQPGLGFFGGTPAPSLHKTATGLGLMGDDTAINPLDPRASRHVHFELPDPDAELLAGIVAGEVEPDPHLTTAEPEYFKLFEPETPEDLECILRLYKLKNQVGTQELKLATGTNLQTSISEIAQEAANSLELNLQKQSLRTNSEDFPHVRETHYSEEGFKRLDQDTENIHHGIITEKKGTTTIIKLPNRKDSTNQELPERTITTWPDEANKRIMYSTSGTDPYSLMVFQESLLSGAKALLQKNIKANLIIFIPPKNNTLENMSAIARLCAMTNCLGGLTPIFHTRPDCDPADAKKFQEEFIKQWTKPELIRDPSLEHPERSENEKLKEAAEIIKPRPEYQPPPNKYLKGTKP